MKTFTHQKRGWSVHALKIMAISSIFLSLLILGVSADPTTTPAQIVSSSPEPQAFDFQLLSNITLRKCQCQGNQILSDSKCVDQETQLLIYDLAAPQPLAVPTSEISKVIVDDIECPSEFTKIKLSFVKDELYFLIDNTVFWARGDHIFDDYCMEHIAYDLNIFVCVENLEIPKCCPSGYVFGSDDSCVESVDLEPFSPPIVFNDEVIEKTEGLFYGERNISCGNIGEQRRHILGEDTDLSYRFVEAQWSYMAQLNFVTPAHDINPATVDFCIEQAALGDGQLKYVAKFCYIDPLIKHHYECQDATCVRKCCGRRQFKDQANCVGLIEGEEEWKPIFHIEESLKPEGKPPANLKMVYGPPICEGVHQLQPHLFDADRFYLLEDGSLLNNFSHRLQPESYCMEMSLQPDGNLTEVIFTCGLLENCYWVEVLAIVLLSLSCVFLIATLAVYLTVGDLRERTNGRCLISMVVAMLAAYICLIANKNNGRSDAHCQIIAFFSLVFGLSMFFWLNVMCYDMWSTLRSSQKQHQSKKTFLKYSIYAWGFPLLIGIIAITIDIVRPENFILPDFLESETCWLFDQPEYWLYFGGIIAILLVVNVFFFVHVALTLAHKLQQRQSVFDNSNSRSSNNSGKAKEKAWLYVRLFLVMGVIWIIDVITAIVKFETCSYWRLLDCINQLQGVFIFLVAVCNKDNLKKLRNAWRPRVQSVRTKISTIRGSSPLSMGRNSKSHSLAMSEHSRKTSVTSLPRKISTTSVPQQYPMTAMTNKDKRITGSSLDSQESRGLTADSPSRKVSTVSNLETIPMHPSED